MVDAHSVARRCIARLARSILVASVLGGPGLSPALAQANGKLQIHFINVGQGDGALVISPLGETVLIDNGVRNNCDLPLSYLDQLGVKTIDYQIISHYHDDHFGCTTEVLGKFPLQMTSFDRGTVKPPTTAIYAAYVRQVGAKRRTAAPGVTFRLDANTPTPVVIAFRTVDGKTSGGPAVEVNNENDRSLVAVLQFGPFDAVFGGDLSGAHTSSYRDVETAAAAAIGQVEVYKVNHHGSEFSSNATWLAGIKPMVAVISAGENSKHGHPTVAAMQRLHDAGARTYWTTSGKGVAKPQVGTDAVGDNIIVEVAPGGAAFTVTYSGNKTDTYHTWGANGDANAQPAFAWSVKSGTYHYAACRYVKNISPANLQRGASPPSDKTLHADCPKTGGGAQP